MHAKALHSHFRENSKSTYSSSVCSLPVTIYTRDQLITLRYCCTLRGTYFRVRRYEPFFFFFFLRLAFYFPASGQAVDSGVVSFPFPPGTTYLQFSSRIGFSVPTAVRRLSSNVANSRSRAFRESICAQEKVPTNLYEYALGGTRTHGPILVIVLVAFQDYYYSYTTGATETYRQAFVPARLLFFVSLLFLSLFFLVHIHVAYIIIGRPGVVAGYPRACYRSIA